ncbi:MAG TPA: NAD(P)H-dependent oxidoreductase [Opitutaceae bacterium]|nr:NAD(P)H-dependent oxidoreductase [Opitutaceae bacterium]HWB99152.1 NAD(P)H-dependent oxidoreductase [Bryobacteraceae bacterium]
MKPRSSSAPIVIIQGHPDSRGAHLGHALAAAYVRGARASGREISIIDVGRIEFPLLRTKEDFEQGEPLPAIREAQRLIEEAGHLVIFYPLWLGSMPALLKGFFEQVFRPGFGFTVSGQPTEGSWKKLSGKSARIVVTMGMPAVVYRWYFRAHSLKSLERNILGFCGIGPIAESLIGQVEAEDAARLDKWIDRMEKLGRKGE